MFEKKKIFKITVPDPCSEKWDEMVKREDGRFCQNCNKVVIDFSHLSDKELYNYFTTIKTIPCGRFHNSQLDVNLIPVKTKTHPWKFFYKPVAALFALLSLKNAQASVKKTHPVTIQPSFENRSSFIPGKVIITGIVKTYTGEPLENAEIIIDEKRVAKTDKEGKFQFELDITEASKSYILVFHYPGLIRTARNYHAAMQSTSYNVTMESLENYYNEFRTTGAPIIITDVFKSFDIDFKKAQTISPAIKSQLSELATVLRNYPHVKVNLVAYANTKQEKALANKRQESIINFLIEMEGVSPKRFIKIIETKFPKNQNLIDISPSTELYKY